MKDIVTLKRSSKGKSLRFLISPTIQRMLNVEFGEFLLIDIYAIYDEQGKITLVDPVMPMPSIVSNLGGTSKGVTMKRDVVKVLQLKPEQSIGIDIKVEKK